MSRYPLLLSTGTSQQKHQDLTQRRWPCFGGVGATVLSSPQGRGHPAASPNTAIPLPAGSWCSEAMNPPDLWYSCEFSTWWAQRLDQGEAGRLRGAEGSPESLRSVLTPQHISVLRNGRGATYFASSAPTGWLLKSKRHQTLK